jgi:hypothetical protein
MSHDVWALAEINNGKLAGISLQLSSKAAELATALGGVRQRWQWVTNVQSAATELGACGAMKVFAPRA